MLPVVDSTSGMTEGKSLGIYLILFQVACVPSRKVGKALRDPSCPADFAGANFPVPLDNEKS